MKPRALVRFASSALLAGVTLSCGGSSTQSTEPKILTTHQELCSGAAPEYEGGYVTAIACPFEQHTDNFRKYGEALASSAALYDGAGVHVADITNTCDSWALGVDPQGVTVIFERSSGRVISHGSVHAGQPMSSLVSPLAAPLAIR